LLPLDSIHPCFVIPAPARYWLFQLTRGPFFSQLTLANGNFFYISCDHYLHDWLGIKYQVQFYKWYRIRAGLLRLYKTRRENIEMKVISNTEPGALYSAAVDAKTWTPNVLVSIWTRAPLAGLWGSALRVTWCFCFRVTGSKLEGAVQRFADIIWFGFQCQRKLYHSRNYVKLMIPFYLHYRIWRFWTVIQARTILLVDLWVMIVENRFFITVLQPFAQ